MSSKNLYFESGNGSKDNPYIISQPVHLYNLAWLQDLGYFDSDKDSDSSTEIKDRYYYFNIDFIKSLDLDGSMYLKSAIPNSKRNLFYDFIDDLPLNQIINKYIPITKKDYFIEKLKKIYYFKKRIK